MSCRSRARMAARDPQVVAYWERRSRLAWKNTGTVKPVEPPKVEALEGVVNLLGERRETE